MTTEQKMSALVDGGIASDMESAYLMLLDAGEIDEMDEAIPRCDWCGETAYTNRPLVTRMVVGYGSLQERTGHANCLHELESLDR